MQTISKVAGAIPVVGSSVSMCCSIIGKILGNIDARVKMPEHLSKCRSKLLHIKTLLEEFETNKLTRIQLIY